MLKSAIYDITELGKDKISKDRHQKQTPYDDYAALYLSREPSRKINCDRTCSAIYDTY